MSDLSHILVIEVDDKYVQLLHEINEQPHHERELWDWQIECPHGDSLAPDRPCSTYYECRCELTEEQMDDLYNEPGPCPVSPTGRHHLISNDDIAGPAYPTKLCWLKEDDGLADDVEDLITSENLRPGRHPITATIYPDHTELSLQTRVS